MMVIVVSVVLIAVVCAVAFGAGTRGESLARVGYGVRIAACVFAVVVALIIVGPAWADSGAFALLLVGVPIFLAAGSLLVKGHGRRTAAVVWVAAVLMLGWALLTGLGSGLFFLGPAIVMVAAATASTLANQSPGVKADAPVS